MKALTSVSKWLKQKLSSQPKVQTHQIDVPQVSENYIISQPYDIRSNIHGNINEVPAYYPKHTKRKGYMNSKSTFNKNK